LKVSVTVNGWRVSHRFGRQPIRLSSERYRARYWNYLLRNSRDSWAPAPGESHRQVRLDKLARWVQCDKPAQCSHLVRWRNHHMLERNMSALLRSAG